jgi:hypothetical protein
MRKMPPLLRFSVLGIEYYYQSEGYSKSAWREQVDFIKLLSKKTGFASLDKVGGILPTNGYFIATFVILRIER